MAEYIERAKAAEYFEKSKQVMWHKDDVAATVSNDSIPTADVAEVRHGCWQDNRNGTFTCSVCGGKSSKMDYCGRCGAKMDGKGENFKFYWYIFADGYATCVRGFSEQELAVEEQKHGRLVERRLAT